MQGTRFRRDDRDRTFLAATGPLGRVLSEPPAPPCVGQPLAGLAALPIVRGSV